MIIELLSNQIPAYWPQIRQAGIRSDGIEESLQDEYAENLLTDLLAGKKTCVLSVSEQRQINLIVIVGVMFNPLKQVKFLKVYNVYGLRKQTPEDWRVLRNDFEEFGKKYDCVGIVTDASHEHIKNVLLDHGFKVHTTTMHYYF